MHKTENAGAYRKALRIYSTVQTVSTYTAWASFKVRLRPLRFSIHSWYRVFCSDGFPFVLTPPFSSPAFSASYPSVPIAYWLSTTTKTCQPSCIAENLAAAADIYAWFQLRYVSSCQLLCNCDKSINAMQLQTAEWPADVSWRRW